VVWQAALRTFLLLSNRRQMVSGIEVSISDCQSVAFVYQAA
jgi:hypothetical protein